MAPTDENNAEAIYCFDIPPKLLDGLNLICSRTDFAHAELTFSMIASTWATYSQSTNWAGLVWDAIYRGYEGDMEDDDFYVDFCSECQYFVDTNCSSFELHFNRVSSGDLSLIDIIPTEIDGVVLWGNQEAMCL